MECVNCLSESIKVVKETNNIVSINCKEKFKCEDCGYVFMEGQDDNRQDN